MKKLLIVCFVVAIVTMIANGCSKSSRDYAYEAYCDSIWNYDSNYYLDVLIETDEYQDYIKNNGTWW